MFDSLFKKVPYDDIVIKLTDENITDEDLDWELILNFCDKVEDDGEQGARDAISAVLKRLAHRNPDVQRHALDLAQYLSTNCGSELHSEIASRGFMQGLQKLITDPHTKVRVKLRALELIESWTVSFENDPTFDIVKDSYNYLKSMTALNGIEDVSHPPTPASKNSPSSRGEYAPVTQKDSDDAGSGTDADDLNSAMVDVKTMLPAMDINGPQSNVQNPTEPYFSPPTWAAAPPQYNDNFVPVSLSTGLANISATDTIQVPGRVTVHDLQSVPPNAGINRPLVQDLAQPSHAFPVWTSDSPGQPLNYEPINVNRPTSDAQQLIQPSHSFPAWARASPGQPIVPVVTYPPDQSVGLQIQNPLAGRGSGTITFSELTEDTYNQDPTKLFCCGLPLPVITTKLPSTTGPSRKAFRFLRLILSFLFDKLPRLLYLYALLHLPALYSTRVSRILEDAELTMPEVRKLYIPKVSNRVMKGPEEEEAEAEAEAKEQNGGTGKLSIVHFKSTWESFVDSLMREWKTLNIVSVLLLSVILTMLQIQGAGDDPVTRTAALLALICALWSLLYGCMYVVRFGSMKRTHQALSWAEEAKKINKSIWWNVWVLLAMPAVWLSWSLILFAFCILSFIWRTGSRDSPPSTGTFTPLTPQGALGVRITITFVFLLGLMYLVLIIKTLREYGTEMDRKWKLKVMEWVAEDMTTHMPGNGHGVNAQPIAYNFMRPTAPGSLQPLPYDITHPIAQGSAQPLPYDNIRPTAPGSLPAPTPTAPEAFQPLPAPSHVAGRYDPPTPTRPMFSITDML